MLNFTVQKYTYCIDCSKTLTFLYFNIFRCRRKKYSSTLKAKFHPTIEIPLPCECCRNFSPFFLEKESYAPSIYVSLFRLSHLLHCRFPTLCCAMCLPHQPKKENDFQLSRIITFFFFNYNISASI
jgi:hypothetical protein